MPESTTMTAMQFVTLMLYIFLLLCVGLMLVYWLVKKAVIEDNRELVRLWVLSTSGVEVRTVSDPLHKSHHDVPDLDGTPPEDGTYDPILCGRHQGT